MGKRRENVRSIYPVRHDWLYDWLHNAMYALIGGMSALIGGEELIEGARGEARLLKERDGDCAAEDLA